MNNLPDAPPGLSVWRYQVGVDGRLSALFGTVALNQLPLPRGAINTIAVLEQGAWREIASFPCTAIHYAWDVAPDDWCVVAEARADTEGKNATAFLRGAEVARFRLGDAIEHIQCDRAEGFWVGYFDELSEPHGLARFLRSGEKQLGYPEPICDCYALNVTRECAWACYYTDFPIVSMSVNGAHRSWHNLTISGASAIAVSAPWIALVGGYEDHRDRVCMLRFVGNAANRVADFDVRTLFKISADDPYWITGRGDAIHVVCAERWASITISDLLEGARGDGASARLLRLIDES